MFVYLTNPKKIEEYFNNRDGNIYVQLPNSSFYELLDVDFTLEEVLHGYINGVQFVFIYGRPIDHPIKTEELKNYKD